MSNQAYPVSFINLNILLRAALVFFTLAVLCIFLSRQPGSIASLWYANAAGAVLLLREPKAKWLWVLLGCSAGNLAANMLYGYPLGLSLAFLPGNLLEMVLAASLIRRYALTEKLFSSPEHTAWFLALAVFIPATFSAVLGAAVIALNGFASFIQAISPWYCSSVLGSVSLLPLLLLALKSNWQVTLPPWPKLILLLLVITLSNLFILKLIPFPFVYLIMPLVVSAFLLPSFWFAFCLAVFSLEIAALLAFGWLPNLSSDSHFLSLKLSMPLLLTLIGPLLVCSSVSQRRRLLESVQNMKDEMEAVFESAPGALLVVSVDGIIRKANSYAHHVFGFAEGQLLGMPIEHLIPVELRLYHQQMRQGFHANPSAKIMSLERRVLALKADQTTFPVSVLLQPVAGVEHIQVVASLRDLTEDLRHQNEMAVSEHFLRSLTDNLPSAVAYIDHQQRVTFANADYVRLFADGRSSLLGLPLQQLLGEARYRLLEPALQRAQAGKSQQFEYQDQQGYMLTYCIPDKIEQKVQGVFLIQSDISTIKQIEAKQLETLALQNAILDNAAYAVITTDLQGVVTIFNRAAEIMLGYAASEVVGKQTPALWHDTDEVVARAKQFSLELGSAIQPGFDVLTAKSLAGIANEHEWIFKHRNGQTFPVLLSVSALRDPQGQVSGYLGMVVDITERKQVEQEREHSLMLAELASRSKTEFVANMSHEIRTPMNAVLGITHLLVKSGLTAEQQRLLTMVQTAGQSLLQLLNDILDFSKIEAGRLELEPVSFSLTRVLNSLATIMAMNAGNKALELAITDHSHLKHRLLGDELRLQQVLINLVGNAIKFTEQGAVSIQIDVLEQTDTHVRLKFAIRDTGIGMTTEQQQRLFQAFIQADASMSRRFGGTGLGLAISKRLIEMMSGQITVNSELGKGSEFSIELPFQFDLTDVTSKAALQALRVLVVDDQQLSRDSLYDAMTWWGWQVDLASSGQDAIELLQQQQAQAMAPHDLWLIDWSMPELEGLATLRALKAVAPACSQVPAMIMVSSAQYEACADQSAGLAQAILMKPITSSSLLERVQELIVPRVDGSTATEPRLALAGVRILLAEDNELNQVVARMMLARMGAEVHIVANGQLAVDALMASPHYYQVVLMDGHMPVMDGFAATRYIRAQLALTVPIIAMTAGVTPVERNQCQIAGMDGFISKPIDEDQMLSVIQRYIGNNTAMTPVASTPLNQHEIESFLKLYELTQDRPDQQKSLYSLMSNIPESSSQKLMEFRMAWQQGQREPAARVLHTLRGSLGTLGAQSFAASCHRLEICLRSGTDDQALPELIRHMETDFQQLMSLIAEWLVQTPAP